MRLWQNEGTLFYSKRVFRRFTGHWLWVVFNMKGTPTTEEEKGERKLSLLFHGKGVVINKNGITIIRTRDVNINNKNKCSVLIKEECVGVTKWMTMMEPRFGEFE